jgi:SP family arabinose:H+ symporter-like MFS transporter
LIGLATSIQLKNGLMAVVFLILWNPAYQWSIASIHWVVIGSVSSDVQFGFISGVHYTNAIILSWTTEYMMQGWGAQGMFYFFAVINFIGYFFVSICMKETNGLSDKEKKALY